MVGFTVDDIKPGLESGAAIWTCPHIEYRPVMFVLVALIGTHTVRPQIAEHFVQILPDTFLLSLAGVNVRQGDDLAQVICL